MAPITDFIGAPQYQAKPPAGAELAVTEKILKDLIARKYTSGGNAGVTGAIWRVTQWSENQFMKTSVSDPLKIAPVSAGQEFGRIGITFCPGKYDPYGGKYDPYEMSGWDRDLGLDLNVIQEWGAAVVVTLLEPQELTLLRVERLGDEVIRRDMLWVHLPIADMSVPDEQFEQQWAKAGEELRSILRRKRDVVIHCRGGLGRAGTIAARLLIELGMKPENAIKSVRSARGRNAIENEVQEEYVRGIGTTRK